MFMLLDNAQLSRIVKLRETRYLMEKVGWSPSQKLSGEVDQFSII
jgi:hypothetical protein